MKSLFESKKLYFISGIIFAVMILAFAGSRFFTILPHSDTLSEKSGIPGKTAFPQGYRIFTPYIPENANFAGEPVPLGEFDIKERLEREFISNTYWHSFTLLAIKRAARFFPVIEPILKQNGIPDDFKYLAVIESGLANVVSPAGATGFWQLMKDPAETYGLEVNNEVDERYHLEKSTVAACKYLRTAHSLFSSWTLAAASYNMGMSGVSRALERQYADNYYDLHLNEETSRYMARIIALKSIIEDPQSYGFLIGENELYSPLQHYLIEVNSPIDDLALFAKKNGISYKTLKYLNPWLREIKLTNRKNKNYMLKMPVK